jgi:sterol desaturase/sphingolipid hydroxylase (fatty acid hydroxylase superfamily)
VRQLDGALRVARREREHDAEIRWALQHSNVNYQVGGLRRWLALNEGHRLHHVARVPEGDVNFGLFTLIWDRLLGTYRDPTGTTVCEGDVGLAGRRDYPVGYIRQLIAPFQRAAKA